MNNSFEKPPVNIQLATEADFNDYKKIRLEALEKDPDAFGEKLEDAQKNEENKWKEVFLKKFIFLAKDRLEPIGIGAGEIRDGEIGFISSVYVRDSFRNQGIASKILKNLENEIKKRGGIKAILYVSKDPEAVARKVYEKLGYSFDEDLKKYDDWEGMVKSL
jgi:predicted GNAT family acetyltransferase